MKLLILGSGSSGNAAILEVQGTRLMIDAGLSAKQLTLRMQAGGVDPSSISAVILSHEHGDHTRGLKTFLKKYPVPLFATPATLHVLKEQLGEETHCVSFDAGQAFDLSHVKVQTFSVPHDAVDPVGFTFSDGKNRLGVILDSGHVTRNMTAHLKDVHALFIEANYDDQLLDQDMKRPWATKQRIRSRHGHLSNIQVSELLEQIVHDKMQRIILGHLSSDCNQPDLVLNFLRECIEKTPHRHIQLHCAETHQCSPWYHCTVHEPFSLSYD
jgi:phosphoribosyl 1,2-cyclic phosphodiesterase